MNPLFPAAGIIDPVLEAPSGTRCLFHQASPPAGWVTDTSITDHLMRVVTSAGGGKGGSTTASNWIGGGTFSVNAFTLSVAQLPSHSHTVNSAHSHTAGGGNGMMGWGASGVGTLASGTNPAISESTTASATTGIASPTTSTGTGGSIQPSYTTPSVKYAAFIVAQKS